MVRDIQELSVLIIEDNQGDFILLEDHLLEKFNSIRIYHKQTFESAVELIESGVTIQIILLDLVLPDMHGEALAKKVKERSSEIPLIILTGYSDISLARKILSMGASDFLIKDEITPEILYKSIIYSLERRTYLEGLSKTKKTYQDLFNLSPQPMWLYDLTTLYFLDVNQAAIKKYGYTYEEFMNMTLRDIRPTSEIPALEKRLSQMELREKQRFAGIYIHSLKSGEQIHVEVFSSSIDYEDKLVRLVLANDVTDKMKHIKKIEEQNIKLKNIAWMQSHHLRAPLSRILGIINLLELESFNSRDLPLLMDSLRKSGNDLDKIVQKIVNESQSLNFDTLPDE